MAHMQLTIMTQLEQLIIFGSYLLHALENLVYFIIIEGSAHSAHIEFRNKIDKNMLIVWNTCFLLIHIISNGGIEYTLVLEELYSI